MTAAQSQPNDCAAFKQYREVHLECRLAALRYNMDEDAVCTAGHDGAGTTFDSDADGESFALGWCSRSS